jgi:hypothetical protein
MSLPSAVYRPRHPQNSDNYHCVEDYFEALMQVYDDNFSRDYGFWRPYIEKVIYRYLDCGDLSHGFARVRCYDDGSRHGWTGYLPACSGDSTETKSDYCQRFFRVGSGACRPCSRRGRICEKTLRHGETRIGGTERTGSA